MGKKHKLTKGTIVILSTIKKKIKISKSIFFKVSISSLGDSISFSSRTSEGPKIFFKAQVLCAPKSGSPKMELNIEISLYPFNS